MFMRSGYSAQTRSVGGASGTEHHHRAPDVVLGGRDLHPAGGPQAGGLALGLQDVGGDVVEVDEVLLGAQLTVGGDRLAAALEHEAVAVWPHGHWPAAVDDAVVLGHVGQGPRD